MGKKLDLVGHVYNKLTVIKEVEPYINPSTNQKVSKWLCQCECGNTKEILGASLRNGTTTSCGCYFKETLFQRITTHGDRYSKEYSSWQSMKDRCLNLKHKNYANYGGRGISICEQWINSYETFLKDVGKAPRPEYTLDRKDNNGNYEPSNVRWTNWTVQAINRRIKSNNTSGVKGVSYLKKSKKWQASICVDYKQIYLGCFTDINDAINARMKAEEKYYKLLLENNYI